MPPADPTTRPMGGPSVAERVVAAGRALPAASTIGWGPGEIPLRPPLGTTPPPVAGPVPWAIVEPADEARVNDPGQAALASWADATWGPGLCYLAGIGWATEPGPLLDAGAIGRMLDAAVVRIWWRDEGGLDALRVVEAVEHGCLPVQLMPSAAAAEARRALPAALQPLVTTMEEATDLAALRERCSGAQQLLRTGSLEREIDLHLAFGSRAADG